MTYRKKVTTYCTVVGCLVRLVFWLSIWWKILLEEACKEVFQHHFYHRGYFGLVHFGLVHFFCKSTRPNYIQFHFSKLRRIYDGRRGYCAVVTYSHKPPFLRGEWENAFFENLKNVFFWKIRKNATWMGKWFSMQAL